LHIPTIVDDVAISISPCMELADQCGIWIGDRIDDRGESDYMLSPPSFGTNAPTDPIFPPNEHLTQFAGVPLRHDRKGNARQAETLDSAQSKKENIYE
jgi:hypothetical protein